MSFFKDFKEDFAQAMNELMPESNEMYDENEEIEEDSSEKESKQNSGANHKQKASAQKKELETKKEDTEALVRTPSRPKKQVPLKQKITEKSDDESDLDIAPEDLTEQIDDMLDQELYGDENSTQMLLNDDMEVNTMDMSVDELLSQIAKKQETISHSKADEKVVTQSQPLPEESKDDKQAESFSEKDMGLEALLNSITSKHSAKDETQKEETEQEQTKEDALNALLESIEQPVQSEEMKSAVEPEENADVTQAAEEEMVKSEEVVEETIDLKETIEETAEPEEVAEETVELKEAVEETTEPEEAVEETATQEEIVEETENLEENLQEKTIADEPEERMEPEEQAMPETSEEVMKPDGIPDLKEKAKNFGDTEETEKMEAEAKSVLKQGTTLNKIEDNIILEENKMSEEKDVISIDSVEEVKQETMETEKEFNVDEADTETTYITKGTKIIGDLQTDGSIDIIGTVEGNITCQGKVVVGGTVTGNITSGEVYANNAKIQGDIKSYGSVKVGVGSMIIGGISGESAVIAGAVNGDIDVQGPVIVDSTAVIMGNIKSRSVQINNGAVIEGFCSQSYSDIDVKSFFA